MTETVESRPVYKTGETLGAILANNEAAQQQVATIPEQVAPESNQPLSVAPVGNANQPTEVVVTPAAEPEAQPEENVTSFATPSYGEEKVTEPAQQSQAAIPATSFNWRDEIKKVDAKELLKELGVNDFAVEMDEYMKKGGDPSDYISKRGINWVNISDEDLVKSDLKNFYGGDISPQQLDRLYSKKYNQQEIDSDEDREDGLLLMRAEAKKIREAKIAEQQNFKIPSAIPVVSNQSNNELQQRQAAEEQRKQFDAAIQWYNEQEATKKLMESKRVAIPLGDMGTFNFAIDKPENLMKPILDGEVWQRITSVNPGEPDANKLIPDVNKLQRLSLVAMNPNYEVDLVNYGKSLKLRELQNEGHNLKAPMRVIPQVEKNTGEKDLWRTAKTGTVGG